MGKIDKTFGDSEFLKRHEYLAFDKTIKTVTPKLTTRVRESRFEYTSSDGSAKTATFKPDTSEYQILNYLIENLHNPVDTSSLVNQLKDPRKDAEAADNKQRARDKIKAITNKLGKELIKKTPNGYLIDCEIVRV